MYQCQVIILKKDFSFRSIKCQKYVPFAEKNQWSAIMSAMPITRTKEDLTQTFREFVPLLNRTVYEKSMYAPAALKQEKLLKRHN